MNDHLLKASDIRRAPATRTVHQFDPNAVRHSHNLGRETGLQRIGIHLVRVEPGHASTTHHYHEADEEFIYILSGRGTARIGDAEFAVAAGDFMGFPTLSPAHSMHNPFDEDLVYLMGGERNLPDIVHYPGIGRSMIKSIDGARAYVDDDTLHDLPPRP